ncbi:sodium-dependent nutrient amino acid transporter 1-like isoform X2 [Condylostylus longicornis]|uniref:sodium-dependent nutrient amino acid transporter 1-like isoform X2 n=1 Tax=Condylostylus longicornis TaxID=2530218 RepID=UPI00244E091D|nr:sodium-dependent nutrient amino acid transporter 1-like isoform X2 [Condylostylus longicornis]
MTPHENRAYIDDEGLERRYKEVSPVPIRYTGNNTVQTVTESAHSSNSTENLPEKPKHLERDLWGKEIEFLLSCIAMSVGLGNVWRFPFTALENGGGAFLIPYLIVLFIVGKPIYYMEMIIGQFSSRGAAKVYDLCPAMRGVGIGQVISISIVTTYYVALMGITLKYFLASFETILPWSVCQDHWNTPCIPSLEKNTSSSFTDNSTKLVSSAELYFLKEVLHEYDNINNGIGLPNWQLVIGLLVSWILIYVVIVRGVKSSGKASYFLAIFPYIVLLILLIRAVTLPGSGAGMLYFIKPQWDQLLNPKVWYSAVTQVFFSLSVCFGNIIMYASYNKFGHNVYRDATIVTLLDTFTSLLAGFTIFGILGHLAHEINTDDIGSVVKGGAGLAFISYPDAIAKFEYLPQAFSVLFFAMLFVLGVGSNIAMTSCTMTAIRDRYPTFKTWKCALLIAVVSFCCGLVYLTPGGQFILNLVDYFGASMICLVLGIMELIVLGWVYGVDRLCKDTEFMIGKNPGLYWRICWGFLTPAIMLAILIYTFASYSPIEYKDIKYPEWAYALGWTISAIGIMQVPIWIVVAVIKQPGETFLDKFMGSFRPKSDWGPTDHILREQYHKFIALDEENIFKNQGFLYSIQRNIFG